MSVRFNKKLIFIILFIACVMGGIFQFTSMLQINNKDKDNKTIRIVIAIYRWNDTFISTMM